MTHHGACVYSARGNTHRAGFSLGVSSLTPAFIFSFEYPIKHQFSRRYRNSGHPAYARPSFPWRIFFFSTNSCASPYVFWKHLFGCRPQNSFIGYFHMRSRTRKNIIYVRKIRPYILGKPQLKPFFEVPLLKPIYLVAV